MKIWRMAFRHILRARRRSLITVLAMAFALGIMIVYLSLMDGLLRDMRDNAILLDMGHVQVHAPGFLEDRSLYRRIEQADRRLAALDSAGLHASARLFASGLAAKDDASVGISLRGTDPEREPIVTRLSSHLLAGRWLSDADPQGVVLGKRLARSLGAGIGDTIVVVSQAADGSVANDLFQVRGILKSVSDETDRTAFYMTIQSFRGFMVMPDGAHEIVIRLPDGMDLNGAAAEITRLCPGLDVRTWKRLNPALAEMIDMAGAFLVPLIVITYIAIAIVILNAMLMAVFERIHEYGILKALGIGPLEVFRLVMAEMTIMAVSAALLGMALGITLALRLQTHGIDLSRFIAGGTLSGVALDVVWRSLITPRSVYMPLLLLFLFTFIAGLYPAVKASWLKPVEAIHHH